MPAQARSVSTQACSGSAQACSLSAQVKAAASHVERLKRKQCEKILGLSIGVGIDYSAIFLPMELASSALQLIISQRI
jgi:hypothetical protein